MKAYRVMSGGMKRLFLFVLLCSLFIFTVDPTGNLLDVCEAFVFSLPEGTEITLLVQCCLFQKYQCPEERLTSQVNRGRKHPQIHMYHGRTQSHVGLMTLIPVEIIVRKKQFWDRISFSHNIKGRVLLLVLKQLCHYFLCSPPI